MMGGVMAGKPLLMAALTGALTLAFAVMAFRAHTRWNGQVLRWSWAGRLATSSTGCGKVP